MFQKSVLATGMLMMVAVAGQAYASAKMQSDIIAEKEVKVVVNGQTVVKRVQAKETQPGDVVIFTMHYSNSGDEAATSVAVNDPIPKGMAYVDNSATGPAGTAITFSVDGKTFAPADKLMVTKTVDGKDVQVKAVASDYAAIQWTISQLAPGKSGEVSFRAQVQ